jgi:hypothetical protein
MYNKIGFSQNISLIRLKPKSPQTMTRRLKPTVIHNAPSRIIAPQDMFSSKFLFLNNNQQSKNLTLCFKNLVIFVLSETK